MPDQDRFVAEVGQPSPPKLGSSKFRSLVVVPVLVEQADLREPDGIGLTVAAATLRETIVLVGADELESVGVAAGAGLRLAVVVLGLAVVAPEASEVVEPVADVAPVDLVPAAGLLDYW